MPDYLELLSEGRISEPWLERALEEVEGGAYTLSELRASFAQGLGKNLAQYQEWGGKMNIADSYWAGVARETEEMIRDLEAGREVVYRTVKIPALDNISADMPL